MTRPNAITPKSGFLDKAPLFRAVENMARPANSGDPNQITDSVANLLCLYETQDIRNQISLNELNSYMGRAYEKVALLVLASPDILLKLEEYSELYDKIWAENSTRADADKDSPARRFGLSDFGKLVHEKYRDKIEALHALLEEETNKLIGRFEKTRSSPRIGPSSTGGRTMGGHDGGR